MPKLWSMGRLTGLCYHLPGQTERKQAIFLTCRAGGRGLPFLPSSRQPGEGQCLQFPLPADLNNMPGLPARTGTGTSQEELGLTQRLCIPHLPTMYAYSKCLFHLRKPSLLFPGRAVWLARGLDMVTLLTCHGEEGRRAGETGLPSGDMPAKPSIPIPAFAFLARDGAEGIPQGKTAWNLDWPSLPPSSQTPRAHLLPVLEGRKLPMPRRLWAVPWDRQQKPGGGGGPDSSPKPSSDQPRGREERRRKRRD